MVHWTEVIGIMVFAMFILGTVAVLTGAYDESTDPSTDPNAGKQYDSGVEEYDYDAHHQVQPAKPHKEITTEYPTQPVET